jgi:hypothetical protein
VEIFLERGQPESASPGLPPAISNLAVYNEATLQPSLVPNLQWTPQRPFSHPQIEYTLPGQSGGYLAPSSESSRSSSQPLTLAPRLQENFPGRAITSNSTQSSVPVTSYPGKPSGQNHDFQSASFVVNSTDTMQGLLPNGSDSCSPPLTLAERGAGLIDVSLDTPCDVAASIIVGMRGYGAEEQVKEELGCKGRKCCAVENTKIFQVMMQ